MRYLPLVAAIVALSAGGCSESKFGGEATVPEVIDNIHAWDGKIYKVRGWLGTCEGLTCLIHESEADMRIVALEESNEDWFAAMDRTLSIASIGDFDESAADYQYSVVEITALVSDECRGWRGGCTDRASDLIPFDISPLNPPSEEK